MKKPRPSLPELLIMILTAAVAMIVFALLAIWTRSLNAAERTELLHEALESVLSEKGEKGLLEMAGVPVDEIHYSYEDLPLFML